MYKKLLVSLVCIVGLSFATGASAATVAETEINDSYAMANSIKIGDTITGELTKVEADIDEDFYVLNVPQDGKLSIKASMLQHLKDHTGHEALQLQLFASSGDGITLYELESGSETFPFYVAKGTYYLRVFSNDQPMKYSLATSFVSGDTFENESNNTQATAKQLIPNIEYTGTLNDGGYDNTYPDVDYYKFELSQDGLFEVTYTPSTRIANSFVIEKANGGQIHYPNDVKNWTEPVNIRLNLEKGVYYLKISDNTSGYNVREYSIVAKFPTNNFNPVTFKDVPTSHPYYEQISFMRQRSIISGYEDNTFRPNRSISRMHVATILSNAGVEFTPIRPGKTFLDVPVSHPYYDEIKALYRAGYADGSGYYFNPDQPLTRAQLAVILVKAFDLKLQSGSSKPFTDVKESDWYYESVKILASNGIAKGSDGKFNPYQHVTRQQFAVFLYQILK